MDLRNQVRRLPARGAAGGGAKSLMMGALMHVIEIQHGLIGTILAKWIGDNHARYLQEELDQDHGGMLLRGRTWNSDKEKASLEILQRDSGREVHFTHCRQRLRASVVLMKLEPWGQPDLREFNVIRESGNDGSTMKILVAVDGSPASLRAVHLAIELRFAETRA